MQEDATGVQLVMSSALLHLPLVYSSSLRLLFLGPTEERCPKAMGGEGMRGGVLQVVWAKCFR